jgi:regulator of replication initiation timing
MKYMYLSTFFLFLFVAAPIATGLHSVAHIRGSLVDMEEEYTPKENSYLLNVEEDNDLDLEDADYRRRLGKGKGSKSKSMTSSMSKKKESKSMSKKKESKSKSKGKGSKSKGKGKGTEPLFACIYDQHSLVV